MWLLVLLGIVSLGTEAHLWRRSGPVGKRLAWTPIIALPLVGPLIYGALYRPLRSLSAGERANERDIVSDSLGARH